MFRCAAGAAACMAWRYEVAAFSIGSNSGSRGTGRLLQRARPSRRSDRTDGGGQGLGGHSAGGRAVKAPTIPADRSGHHRKQVIAEFHGHREATEDPGRFCVN
jgi:hypothetical protein